MAIGIKPRLDAALEELRSLPDILSVAIARRDGLIIDHDLPAEVDPRKVAAMAAAIVGTSEMSSLELGRGRFLQVIVNGEDGRIIATGAGEEALVLTLVRNDANMGLVLLGIDKAVHRIEECLREA